MNNLLDKFPVDLPARFSNRAACFDKVYIISNLPLDKLYIFERQGSPEVYNAFIARIHNIIKFTALGVWHYEKKDGITVPPLKEKQIKFTDLAKI